MCLRLLGVNILVSFAAMLASFCSYSSDPILAAVPRSPFALPAIGLFQPWSLRCFILLPGGNDGPAGPKQPSYDLRYGMAQ